MKIVFAFSRAIIWAICILVLCIINPGRLPKIQVNWDIGPDKIVHFTMFGLLSYLLIFGIRQIQLPRNYFWFAGLASSLYGVFIEYLQGAYFTSRSFDYADMLANAIGAMAVSSYLFLKSE